MEKDELQKYYDTFETNELIEFLKKLTKDKEPCLLCQYFEKEVKDTEEKYPNTVLLNYIKTEQLKHVIEEHVPKEMFTHEK